jgi:hypothetical protein
MAQGEGRRPRRSQRVGGVVEAGSRASRAWRSRRSRRCSILCSGPAPPQSRTAPPSSGSSRTRHSTAATRQRRRGSPAFPAPPSLLLPSPPPASPSAAALEGGKTPMWVGGDCPLPLALLPLLNPRRRKDEANFRCCPPPGLDRPVPVAAPAAHSHATVDHEGQGAGQKRLFLPPALAWFARGRPVPRRACRPGGSAAPRAARAGATGPAALWLGVLAGLAG